MVKKINNPLEAIRGKDNSIDWYRKQIRTLGISSPTQAMQSGLGKFANSITIGSMYLYAYDAKHKDTLEYWDMFPLVFPFAKAPGGFLGINLHYLPYLLRVRLLEQLAGYQTAGKLTETTRLKLSWGILEGVALATPCVKRYLNSHIQSRFLEIDARDWKTVSLLPIESFVGKPKETVFMYSKTMI